MYTNSQLLDSIITEMYDMFKALVSGNYAVFCASFAEVMSKLCSLREGLKKENEAAEARIGDLKAQLERATTPHAAPDEVIIGGETNVYDFNLNKE